MSQIKKWGRNDRPTVVTSLLTIGLMFSAPFIVAVCSYVAADGQSITQPNIVDHLIIYVYWVIFQMVLMKILPCRKSIGSVTPAGNQLTYSTNGLVAAIISLIGYIWLGNITYIANHWFGWFIVTNLFGNALAVLAYVKGRLFPTHIEDVKTTNWWLYDFYMGIELNPRIGDFDFKLFFNGRPGIIGWLLINLSFAGLEYENYGRVSYPMIVINILQGLYVLDFFYHESWYLRTIDIAHDHFGWMLAWGDSVWLPFMYTLQAQYLAYHDIDNNRIWPLIGLLMGFAGYYIFRSANWQKDHYRRPGSRIKYYVYVPDTNKRVARFRKPKYIKAKYQSTNREVHESKLLIEGFWGWCRHSNYLGDLMMALSYGITCGLPGTTVSSYIPYIYFGYMSILLIHRCYRDEYKCAEKYGKYWDSYCEKVRYRIIPGVF